MADVFKVHDVARVKSGRYWGLVGTVTETRQEGDKQTGIRLLIEGVQDGHTITRHVWVKRSQVERNHGA